MINVKKEVMSSMYSISKDGWFCIPEGGSWYPSVIEFRKLMPNKAMRFIKNIFCKNGRLCGEISDKYKLKEEKLVALVSKTYAKSGAIHGIRVRFNDGVIGDLCWPLFDKSCKCLMYRDEEAHSIGKFFSVFYISSEDMLPQYAADKFIDGYKHSVNL